MIINSNYVCDCYNNNNGNNGCNSDDNDQDDTLNIAIAAISMLMKFNEGV